MTGSIRVHLEQLVPRLGEETENPWHDGLFAVQDLRESGELKPIIEALRAWHGAAQFDEVMRHFGESAHSLSLDELAEWLLLRCAEVGIDQTLDELTKYAERTEYDAVFTLWLSGLQVAAPLELADGIRLLPIQPELFEDLALISRDEVTNEKQSDGMGFITSVLSLRVRHPKILTPRMESPTPVAEESSALGKLFLHRLDVARLLCALIEPRDITRSGQRAQILPSVPCHLRASYASFRTTGHSMAYGYVYEEFGTKVRALQDAYSAVGPNLQRKLIIPLERLQNSMHEVARIVDSSIDLGIAIESLLTEDADASELSYRLSTRAARLIASSLSEREAARRLFKALYNLRSRAVHRGKVDLKAKELAGRPDAETLLRDGIKATADAIRGVINRNITEWSRFDLS